jgi:RNA polymerase sigma-70 factor (ECF subfamily)
VRWPEDLKSAVPEALEERREELVAFARRRVGERAEDVVQDAAVRALRSADQLAQPEAARAWLFSIVRHLSSEPAGRVMEEVSESVPVERTEPPDSCDCVMKQVEALPTSHAELLRRVTVEGAPVNELAKELGITPNALWVRLHRAREALKTQLEKHCGTTSFRACLDCGCLERGCCR